MGRWRSVVLVGSIATSSAWGLAAGCGSSSSNPSTFPGQGNGLDATTAADVTLSPATDSSIQFTLEAAPSTFTDFPAPITDGPDGGTAAPANAAMLFANAAANASDGGSSDAGSSDGGVAGPCLIEPELNSLYPRNWLRPRFRWLTANGENLFELRLHAANQTNDLLVYTTATSWTMPLAMWNSLRMDSQNVAMTVTVRGASYDGTNLTNVTLGSSGPIGIAPVDAPGSIVYWTTSAGTKLRGFRIGDESVTDVLTPSQVGPDDTCVACHSSTPDGTYVGFSLNDSNVGIRSADGDASVPPFLTSSASSLLARGPQYAPVFSGAHWDAGDRIAISELALSGSHYDITWTDLEATSQTQGTAWGVIARDGDDASANFVQFRHDGTALLYASGDPSIDGMRDPNGDLYTVPYNNRQGGTPTKVPGASDPAINEYYPSLSTDDKYIAFGRLPSGQDSYNNPASEVFVIPSVGGTPTRLAANDPPACSGKKSPGVTNSWPKWSPDAVPDGARTYYFLVFSSTRSPDTTGPQLYVTPVLVEGSTVTTYGALYLWNQPVDENNHTPAWDNFAIPQVPQGPR